LVVQAPTCLDLLQNCLLSLSRFEETLSWPLNFHDLRLLKNKAVFGELIDVVLVLYDSSLLDSIRNIKERKINSALSLTARDMVSKLQLKNERLLIKKLLINLLIIVHKEQA
jgi:hypothetical protein